ncbi:GAF domain-containing sensor histidine kinase [Dactylosporangium sp. NPDC005572]|uniref:GAF domain-containing sensor histidine kinase n=1 Tax=Dactylosporangium sp. NPDC005572 TaxID=3156889 RepID=UPI0033BB25C9
MNHSQNQNAGEHPRLAEAQVALRRIAVLVAHGATEVSIFDAVAAELAYLVDADLTNVIRYEPDGTVTMLAARDWSGTLFPVGVKVPLDGQSVAALVSRSGRSARMDNYTDAPGPLAALMREQGVRSTIGAPVVVERHLWGVVTASMTRDEPWTFNAEMRLTQYTELVAIAIANAQARADLAASRARAVIAADQALRRIERNLHDGVQQRLLALALEIREAETGIPGEMAELRERLSAMASGLTGVLDDLREISRGIHPAILSDGGLRPALRALTRRCSVPTDLSLDLTRRLPEPVEIAAYYIVAEALANTIKHANASVIHIDAEASDSRLYLSVIDDGIGGASPARGSGLTGLTDRVDALGGTITISSPTGQGTNLRVVLPLECGHPSIAGLARHR